MNLEIQKFWRVLVWTACRQAGCWCPAMSSLQGSELSHTSNCRLWKVRPHFKKLFFTTRS